MFKSCEPSCGKTGLNVCTWSFGPDLTVQSAQANQGRHSPPTLEFRLEENSCKRYIQKQRKVSSLISLCELHRLIMDNTLRICIKPSFPRMRLILAGNTEIDCVNIQCLPSVNCFVNTSDCCYDFADPSVRRVWGSPVGVEGPQ